MMQKQNQPNRNGGVLKIVIVFLVLAGGAAAGLVALQGNPFHKTEEHANLIFETVKRGSLEISITERGNLESANNDTIVCLVEGESGTGILKIKDEGTLVKKGELLVELDSSKLKNDLTAQEIKLEQASATLKTAEKNLEIQQTQNDSDIAAAELKLKLAELDLDKYQNGDYVQEKETIDGEIKLALEEVTRAQEKYNFTKRLAKKGYAKQSEVEADRVALEKARINHQAAETRQKVLEDYTKGRSEAELKANAQEYKRELDRVKLKGLAALDKYEADLKAAQKTYEVEAASKKKIEDQIELCLIYAKRDGMVVYVNQRSGGFRGSSEPLIYEGAKVKERQPIINLPDVTHMQVNARIHESKIAMVRQGLPATIHLDAQAGEVFKGEVDKVSLVPTSGNWPNVNLKEYITFIKLTDAIEKVSQLKPGMTAEVEILIDRLSNVLQAPVQSFVERGGKHFAWTVEEGKLVRHEVKVGRSNEQNMEIIEGLSEGDRLVQTPRTVLPKEISQLEIDVPATTEAATNSLKTPEAAPPGGGRGGPGGGRGGERGAAGSPGGGEGGPMAGGPGGRRGNRDPAEAFAFFDKNGDGKITEDEAPDFLKGNFARVDTNKDKAIDLNEFKNMPRPSGGEGGGRRGGPEAGGGQ
jgi:HlyD family secretion protein